MIVVIIRHSRRELSSLKLLLTKQIIWCENWCAYAFISSLFRTPVLVLPSLPEDPNKNLEDWFGLAEGKFLELRVILENAHFERLRRLEEMPKKASDILWWPFTQHDLVAQDSVTLIDSRSGEDFSVFKVTLLRS